MNIIRKLVRRLNESLRGYQVPARQKACLPVSVSLEPESNSLRNKETGRLVLKETNLNIKGETYDLSENGIAFILPAIRVGQNYLAGAGIPLSVTLDLPKGKVCLKAMGQRYAQLGENPSTAKYLIGANILRMNDHDRRIYNDFLQNGIKLHKSDGKNLALGINNR